MAWLMELNAELDAQEARTAHRRQLCLTVHARGETDQATEATVRDLSANGLLIETSLPLTLDSVLRIDLPDAQSTEAQVVWASGRFYGCEFVRPVTQSTISAALLRAKPARPGPNEAENRTISEIALQPPLIERALQPAAQDGLSMRSKAAVIVVSSLTLWTGILAAATTIAQLSLR